MWVAAAPKPIFTVQVRELVQFALRTGGLVRGGDFVGPDRALAGTRGHQRVQRSRPAAYQKEVRLFHDIETAEFILRIQGRIDGLLATPEEVLLEEIKTVQGGWDGAADPLHWAQAKLYGFIYARDRSLENLAVQLTYLDLESGKLTEFRNRFSRTELSAFFEETTAIYLEWIRDLHLWRQKRDNSIKALAFPFPAYRFGQRELAVASYKLFERGGRLFLEAPTGIGKTISVLFPAVKALGEGKLDQIFYLTARTVGRAVAQKALGDLRTAGLRLRSLTLTSRESLCVRDGKPCDAQTCPFALDYYDRCKPAMREALRREDMTRPVLEEIGRVHQVCPHELSLDLSMWVDAVICDYNYVFDPKVYLRRHFAEKEGDQVFLVDEAHNLVDRAREMFSSDLDSREINDVKRAMKRNAPRCAKALARLESVLRKLGGSNVPVDAPVESAESAAEFDLFPARKGASGNTAVSAESARQVSIRDEPSAIRSSREFPQELTPILENALKEAETWLARNQPAEFREKLLELYFRLHSFHRTAELYDERYITIIESAQTARVRLFCLDPSFLLRQALERGKAAIFFSATLAPLDYYRALLGGSPDDPIVRLPSPFPSENLAVLVQDRIRTQLKDRASTLVEVVQAVGALVRGRPGNYLVYLPSYQYLAAVRDQFRGFYPAVRLLKQRPGMTEVEREEFLAAFAVEHGETLVGFAVMGGIFGEGIDLVGDRLIGAIIVGVGLPQICVERDLIRDYFQEQTGAGFDFAYTFPGMNRVLQATGRVIRSETDRGVVLLIDARFGESRYRRLFPDAWQPVALRRDEEIREAVNRFWAKVGR